MNDVRLGVMDQLPHLLQQRFGVDLAELSRCSGFDVSQFSRPQQRCPLPDVLGLLEHCAHITGQDHFGALLARAQQAETPAQLRSLYVQHMQHAQHSLHSQHSQHSQDLVHSLDLVQLCSASADTLGGAIQSLADHQHLNAGGAHYQLVTAQGFAYLLLHLQPTQQPSQHQHDPKPPSAQPRHSGASRQGILFMLTQCYLQLRALSANQWRPQRLCLKQAPPRQHAQLRAMFELTIQFNADFDGYIFDAAQLSLTLPRQDRRAFALVQDYLKLSGQYPSGNKLSQIKAAIRAALLLRQSCPLPSLASGLHMSVRALQYYLAQHQLKFQQLLAEVRFELAADLLCNSEQPISAIAEQVGFADIAVFSRSFKKYTGLTPSQYRRPARPAMRSSETLGSAAF